MVTTRSYRIAALSLLAIAVLAFYLFWLWHPERQVRSRQASVIRAVENRDWKALGRYISADYEDRWNQDRELLIQRARGVLSGFYVLEIRPEGETVVITGDSASVTMRVEIDGTGTYVADLAKREVARIRTPFTFQWEKRSWKPWAWQIVRIDNPELRIPESQGFF